MSERKEGDPIHASIREVCETFGLSLEVGEKSSIWADRWKSVLLENGVEDTSDPATLTYARDVAFQDCPDITRDENGDPSFRSLYAAQQLLYRTMPAHADTYRSALEGDGIRITPHFDRLDEIVETLIEVRERNEFPYGLDAAMLPQDERNMPPSLPRGGREHANWLFAGCGYMRGGIKSTTAFKSLSKIYAKEPELFDPYNLQHDDPARITVLLQENGLAFNAEFVGRAWVENARRMVELYDGDPTRIFDGSKKYEDIVAKVKNNGRGKGFLGFREKMTSMIAYYLMEAEIMPYFDFPLPVDIHVLRVSASNEIITFENLPKDGNILSERTLDMLRRMYHDFSVTHGTSQLDVCNAVWSLSSSICGEQPGNIMKEPGRKEGRQGRSTHIIPTTIDARNQQQIARYKRTCLHCPVERTCEHNMPSKEYNVKARAVLSDRVRFVKIDEPFFSDEALRRMTKRTPRKQYFTKLPSVPSEKVDPADEALF